MNQATPLISVLTPTWNRASYLRAVCSGLKAQTYTNFEWLVANDGSADDTIDVVRELAKDCNFPITLVSASTRIGKARMDNELVRLAAGEFIIWCDSDDWFLPNALETLIATWMSIPEAERDQFAGITAMCDFNTGAVDNIYPNSTWTDASWNDVFSKMKYDLVLFCKAVALKEAPFLEVDFVIPETSVWSKIGVKKTRYIPTVLKRVNYNSDNCISFSGAMAYNRGRAYAMIECKPFAAASHPGNAVLAWRLITYFRYCIHGDIPIWQAIGMWGGGLPDIARAAVALPPAALLAIKDIAQGKVRKTHREFLKAKSHVSISIERLSAIKEGMKKAPADAANVYYDRA